MTAAESRRNGIWHSIKESFQPKYFIPSLSVGLSLGILAVAIESSLAALIFTGELKDFVSQGLGLTLLSLIILGIITTIFSSWGNSIALPQEAPVAILAVMAAGFTTYLPPDSSSSERFATFVAAIGLSSLLTGLFFLLLGTFKLGKLVRFLPFPVIGGFLAGTGWLLAIGSIEVMTNQSIRISNLGVMFDSATAARWLPGILLAVIFIFMLSRFSHYLLMPGLIIGSSIIFYIVALASGQSTATLSAEGWLLGPFPADGIRPPFLLAELNTVNWVAVFSQAGNIGVLILVSLIGFLLNATGIEMNTGKDADINYELRVVGFANIATGLVGGVAGYQSLSLSALNEKLANGRRLTGFFSMGVCAVMLFFGGDILSLTPRVVVGGLLFFLGISFLAEWVYEAYFKLPKIEYAVVLLILIVIASVGFLEGVGVGLFAAVVLFVINYSRINVVREELSGESFRSRVTRPSNQYKVLLDEGNKLYILRLHGYIFFGSANSLLDQVKERFQDPNRPQPEFVILDFRQVTGIDSTALYSFTRMGQLADSYGAELIITAASAEAKHQFEETILEEEGGEAQHFESLDRGVEWCENQILAEAGIDLHASFPSLEDQLTRVVQRELDLRPLFDYLEKLELGPGDYLIHQGDTPDDMFFVKSGQLTAQLEKNGATVERLETMGSGRVLGELGFYLDQVRTAAVVVDKPSVIYRLTRSSLQKMEEEHPDLASALHQLVIHLVAERTSHLIRTVSAIRK